jgi:hypothetical protein
MPLTQEQLIELRSALESGFDANSLAALVYVRLRHLYGLVAWNDPLRDIVFNLIQVTEQQGIADKLIREAYYQRPRNKLLQDYCTRHFVTAFPSASADIFYDAIRILRSNVPPQDEHRRNWLDLASPSAANSPRLATLDFTGDGERFVTELVGRLYGECETGVSELKDLIEAESQPLPPDRVASDQRLQGDLRSRLQASQPPSYGIPPVPDLFLGREGVLADLRARLGVCTEASPAPSRLLVIRGWPGVGKTSVAAALARDDEVRRHYQDGLLWMSLGQVPDILRCLAEWGRYLRSNDLIHANTIAEARNCLSEVLRGKRMLLVLDDVWEATYALPFRDVVTELSSLVITTRLPEVADAVVDLPERVFPLPLLDEKTAVDLLSRLAPKVIDAESAQARELAAALEYLPLSLQVAGRLLRQEAQNGWGVNELLNELKNGRRLLTAKAPADRWDVSNQTTPTVAALLQQSISRLDDLTRDRYALLGGFAPKPATFDLAAMVSVWEVDRSTAMQSARDLRARGLLEPIGGGRFQMHALLVAFADSLCT